MFIGKKPQAFFNSLKDEHGFKLNGVGKPSYHLGGDFFCDPDGTLAWGAQSYVEKMLINYETMFGSKPKEYSTPMAEKDHPELDNSELLDDLGIKKYQSLIGALQWLVTLGCFDIHLGVATMSSFRVAPHQGNLESLKRMYGYLKRNPAGATRLCLITIACCEYIVFFIVVCSGLSFVRRCHCYCHCWLIVLLCLWLLLDRT